MALQSQSLNFSPNTQYQCQKCVCDCGIRGEYALSYSDQKDYTVRVASGLAPPFVNPCFTDFPRNCTDPGFSILFFYEILTNLRLQVQFFKLKDITEALEGIRDGQYDLTTELKVVDHVNWKKITWSSVVAEDRFVFIVKQQYSDDMSKNLVFSSLHWTLWVTCIGTYVGLRLIKLFLGSTTKNVWYYGYTAWNLVLAIIMNIYSNDLAIKLSQPPSEVTPFSTLLQLSELLITKQCRLIVPAWLKPTGAFEDFLNIPSNSSTNAKIRSNFLSAFAETPPKWATDDETLVEAVQSNECYIGMNYLTSTTVLQSKYCQLRVIMLDEVAKAPFAYAVRKEADFAKQFLSYTSGGLHDYFMSSLKRYQMKLNRLHHRQQVSCSEDGSSDSKPLTIFQLVDAMYLLLVCALVGLLTVVCEKLILCMR